MDKRQIKTRRAISHAMVRLMNKLPYDKIFVKDIIEEAEIGRSTFYAHFETKEDLVQSMCFNLFDHVFAEDVSACVTHDFSMNPHSLENDIAHIFYHLRDKHQYYSAIINYNEGRLFVKFFKEYVENNLVMITKGESNISISSDFFKNHLYYTFIGALQWWLKGRMEVEPKDIAEYFATVINPVDIEFKRRS